MTNPTKTNNLNYLINPTFTKVNRLFVLLFENEEERTSFLRYYVPKVEIKDFNVLIDRKSFLDVPVKNKEEAYEKIISISKNNDYTTGNLLDYEYFSKHYKLIAIDLRKQIKLENPNLKQQINFIGKLEADSATTFFIIEKSEETTFVFLQKIINLLNDSSNEESKFATKKWYVIDSQTTKGKYKQGDTIKFETETIKSSLCDYSDAFILVTGNITVAANNDTDVAFKNCAPFSTCTTKINDMFVDEANHIYIAMPMYNLIQYSDNYSDTSGSLWQFKRDEVPANNADLSIDNSKLFKYKAALVGKTANAVNNTNSSVKDAKIVVPLKYLSNLEIIRNATN